MKLEYLHDITANGKYKDVVCENLIRLWDFGPSESKKFQDLILKFSNSKQQVSLDLDKQDFIKSINCKLTLKKDILNNGINRLSEDQFICKLNNEGYFYMVELIQPFVIEDSSGHNWLDEKANIGNINFLFSPGGTW